MLYLLVDKLLGRGNSSSLPEHDNVDTLGQTLNDFFISKIVNTRSELAKMETSIQA